MTHQKIILEQENQLEAQPVQSIPAEERQQQQQENSSSGDWTSGVDPIDLVDLAVELGKGAIDIVGSALDHIDINF